MAAGRPVEITFIRKETSGCGGVVWFPGLNVKRTLKPAGKTVVAFTLAKSGVVPFTCGMKMYQGRVTAR